LQKFCKFVPRTTLILLEKKSSGILYAAKVYLDGCILKN